MFGEHTKKEKHTTHVSVFHEEVIDALELSSEKTIVDATLGSGGHAATIINQLSTKGVFVGIDADSQSIDRVRPQLSGSTTIRLVEGNFRKIDTLLASIGITGVDGIIFDLGWNSDQFEHSGRGFSFLQDEPLDMRFNVKSADSLTAKEILNEWAEESIADIIYGYGEERFARKIAHKIVERREEKPIATTFELVAIIKEAVPAWYRARKIHPATKTFQALRIAVNDELEALKETLPKALGVLNPKGRCLVISFHSLEDRIVKRVFKEAQKEGIGTVLTKKPMVPSREEVRANPRARSAKLRIFEKTPHEEESSNTNNT